MSEVTNRKNATQFLEDRQGSGPSGILGLRELKQGELTTSGSNQQYTFDAGTRFFSIYAVENVRLEVGDDPVAVSTSHFIPKATYLQFSVHMGGGHFAAKIGVLQDTAPGKIYISELC